MTALVPTRGLVDSIAELFEPVDSNALGDLLLEYADQRATLERVASIFADQPTLDVLRYFADGNGIRERGGYVSDRMFGLPGAVKALNASYWQRALEATDVLDVMPAERREQWRKQIENLDVPEFTEAAIHSTIAEHLASRHKYFAERVDGLFRALSPEHKTNLPTGFRSKLIINYAFDSDGDPVSGRVDVLADLRIVVAKFMGRDDIGEGGSIVHGLTRKVARYARRSRCGEWVSLDGGAIEIKAHQCGTCHVRVHDEIAWRLNAVLAYLHPHAVPESSRTRPKRGASKRPKPTPELVTRPLPFAVLKALATFESREDASRWTYGYGWRDLDKHVRSEVEGVLASIGGVFERGDWGACRFDYDAREAIGEILASGCVPDQKAHQFYPTPTNLAARVVELAGIGPDDRVLEPSAGQGAIAELLPRERTTCVEASALHCAVLRAKGLTVVHGDFLQMSRTTDALLRVGYPTRVVMNPPFDRGQWRAHVEHAATFISEGGRLVAILPSGAPSKLDLPGFNLTWSEPIEGAFAGTSISVVILVATRA